MCPHKDSNSPIYLAALGHALIDTTVTVTLDTLRTYDFQPSHMYLVDLNTYTKLKNIHLSQQLEQSVCGGSVCNSVIGLADLDAPTAFIGNIAPDHEGYAFQHNLQQHKVVPMLSQYGAHTGSVLVFSDPNKERTMATFLGDSSNITAEQLQPILFPYVSQIQNMLVEGYLLDSTIATQCVRQLCAQLSAHDATKILLSLSDALCVQRNLHAFRQLIHDFRPLLFANEQEILTLLQLTNTLSAIDPHNLPKQLIQQLSELSHIVCITLGSRGAMVVSQGQSYYVQSQQTQVTDLTGAGDLFVSGFVYALYRRSSLTQALHVGNLVAAQAVSHVGTMLPAHNIHNLKQQINSILNTH